MNLGALATIATLALFCSGPEQEEREEPEVTRDELYKGAIEKLRALENSWKTGSAELPRSIEELERAVAALEPKRAESGTQSKTVPPPKGPFPPSSRPSPEEEQERRRRATEERFPTGGPLEKETASLEGVPDERVQASCDAVQAELARFKELRGNDDRRPADASLQKAASILRGLRGIAKPSR